MSFQIKPGQLVALVGPTGAGNTTVTGWREPSFRGDLISWRIAERTAAAS